MVIDYKTRGVCARRLQIEVEGTVVQSMAFDGGCHGNLQGLSRLIAGMEASEVIARLEGVRCNGKSTSCPDQLACALRDYLANTEPQTP